MYEKLNSFFHKVKEKFNKPSQCTKGYEYYEILKLLDMCLMKHKQVDIHLIRIETLVRQLPVFIREVKNDIDELKKKVKDSKPKKVKKKSD